MSNPKKSQTLHVETLNDELSVYDWQRLQMHSLNPTAAKVFEMCDGQTSPDQMAARLDAPEAVVWQSLDELGSAHLLSDAPEKPASYQSMTRQQFLKLSGAVALASIVSIVVPRPVAAQSPGAGAGTGGGGGGVPITRTATVGTLPADNTFYFFAFTTPITDAEIAAYEAACGAINQYTVAWDSGNPNITSDTYIYLSQAFGGPRAQQVLIISAGDGSPKIDNFAGRWTNNRPYNGIEISKSSNNGAGPWTVGTVTITLERI
ncbi:MAG: PqqD family protein [Chloroflexota bacterium]|nr:PqqD family protein [Chloroflexota bacterium]